MKNKKYKKIFRINGILAIVALCAYLCIMCIDREKEAETKPTISIAEQIKIAPSVNAYLEESYKRVVVLKFYANWCPPCKRLAPIFETIAKEYVDQHLYASINIEDDEELTNFFDVKGIPNIVILRNSDVVDRIIGLVSKNDIIAKILQHDKIEKKSVEQQEKLVIIGSGPAGLTAAVYAARAGLEPIVIEGPKPGGQLMDTSIVENWPGYEAIAGADLIATLKNHAKQSGARLLETEVIAVDFTKAPFFSITINDSTIIKTKSVIIASGATPKRLYCPGEDTFFGNGISTCALCDGALYKNKRVVIVGGGYTAVEDALFLRRFTDKITIVQLHDQLKVSETLKEKISKENGITIIYNSTVTQFIGSDNQLKQVEITNTETKEKTYLDTDGVFLAIGLSPNAELFCDQLECEKTGHIKAYNHVKTSISGIFVAGDVQDMQYRQAIVSAGFGSMAAIEAEKYLQSIAQ